MSDADPCGPWLDRWALTADGAAFSTRYGSHLAPVLAAGQPAGLLTLSVASWIAYCLSGAHRFGGRWTPDDPYAGTVIAIGEKVSDWTDLAKSVLAIAPIFGSDMAHPQLVDPVARHLSGLLRGDTRGYLSERLGDD